MQFTKMHGIGNDYVYVNGFAEHVNDPISLSKLVSDRHFGIGGDGLILILPSNKADVRMRMFNADGGESEMCGNGIRCVAKYAFEHGLTTSNPMRVETGRGVLSLSLSLAGEKVDRVTVNMGEPILDLPQIPVDRQRVVAGRAEHEYRLHLPAEETTIDASFVSMGNPHAVIFVREVESVDVVGLGPTLENHAAFPRRTNVHWVQVHIADRGHHANLGARQRGHARLRHWRMRRLRRRVSHCANFA